MGPFIRQASVKRFGEGWRKECSRDEIVLKPNMIKEKYHKRRKITSLSEHTI